MTILLVDDEPAGARLYGAVIERHGFDVRICYSATDALDLIREHPIRLIMSDVEMPDMSGHDMARRLLSRGKRPCPILFLSASDTVNHIANGLRAGGDDFLIKGCPLPHILDRVTFWLTSGFLCLPHPIRMAALDHLDTLNPTSPVLSPLDLDRALIDRVFEILHRDIQATPSGFGSRLIDRIHILGRADALLRHYSHTPAHWLRFPDALVALIRNLNTAWSADVAALMKYYGMFEKDDRFKEAGAKSLASLNAPLRASS